MNTVMHELDIAAKTYPNAKITGEMLDIYAEDLRDLPGELVVRAIRECRRTSTFFPALAEIRNRVVTIAGEGVLVDAEAAWGEVLREASRVGYNRTGWFHQGEHHDPPQRQFSSPLIARAVDAIGWRDICLTEVDQLGTLRAQFRDALRAIQHREVDRVVSGRPALVGAIGDGAEPAKRDGLTPISSLVEFKDRGAS